MYFVEDVASRIPEPSYMAQVKWGVAFLAVLPVNIGYQPCRLTRVVVIAMDAPVSPAGLPAIGISAAREDTEEIASLPAMSVQDGTDANAIGPREGGQGVPLTAEALAIMGLNDPRRNAPSAVSEWAYVTSPAQHRASLAGSPQQFNSAHYSPSDILNLANYFQQHVLAPT